MKTEISFKLIITKSRVCIVEEFKDDMLSFSGKHILKSEYLPGMVAAEITNRILEIVSEFNERNPK